MGRVKMTIPNWRCNRVLNKFKKEKKNRNQLLKLRKKKQRKKEKKKEIENLKRLIGGPYFWQILGGTNKICTPIKYEYIKKKLIGDEY